MKKFTKPSIEISVFDTETIMTSAMPPQEASAIQNTMNVATWSSAFSDSETVTTGAIFYLN